MLSKSEQEILLDLAEAAIKSQLTSHSPPNLDINYLPANCLQIGCSFVTLLKHGELRGCIGALEPYQPLANDVIEHAQAAAFRDTRFLPVSADELADLDIEISVLEAPSAIEFKDEIDLLQKIKPQEDGLILTDGQYRSTFLPSVWESLPDAQAFWTHLKQKAGLPADYWSDTIKVQRYRVQKFSRVVELINS